MLCIFAFIVFLILFPVLGFFPEYRKLFRRSWECVFKKIRRQPCDINLGEELKNKILGKMMFKFPKFTRFIDKTFAFWAFLFVVLNIWSVVYVASSGLNLWVYDTCDPNTGESCSLSGEACGVASNNISFSDAFKAKKLDVWVAQPFNDFGTTLTRIPDRVKNWNSKDYLVESSTYYKQYDDSKPVALEIIDPGCQFCKKLFNNIKEAKFYEKYNLTYILYPIPDSKQSQNNGYKFQSSQIVSKYLEALKRVPLETNPEIPADWQLLEMIFTEVSANGQDFQSQLNFYLSKKDIPGEIEKRLEKIGYNQSQINRISELVESVEVNESLAKQKDIVENQIKTIKIPTIMFDGRRFDRVVETDKLK